MTDENCHYSSIKKKKSVSSLRQLLKILLSAFGVKRCRPIYFVVIEMIIRQLRSKVSVLRVIVFLWVLDLLGSSLMSSKISVLVIKFVLTNS